MEFGDREKQIKTVITNFKRTLQMIDETQSSLSCLRFLSFFQCTKSYPKKTLKEGYYIRTRKNSVFKSKGPKSDLRLEKESCIKIHAVNVITMKLTLAYNIQLLKFALFLLISALNMITINLIKTKHPLLTKDITNTTTRN